MKEKYNLKLVLLLLLVTLTLIIGSNENWIGVISIAVMIYYFVFLINVFKKLHSKENFLTKIFLSHLKTPMYLATLMLVGVQILEKLKTNLNFEIAYTACVVGFIVGIIALIKIKKLAI